MTHAAPITADVRGERFPDPRNIATLARKELRDALRNRWFILYTVAFAVLALGLAYLSRASAGLTGLAGFGRTAASLINLVLLIVPLMGLSIGAASLASERERGMLGYLLAQPVGRMEVLLGKFIGLALALTGSLAIGFGISGLVLARGRQGADTGAFVNLVLFSFVLAAAMLAVGILISTLARRSGTATGAAVFTWLILVFFGDLGLMGAAVIFRLQIPTLLLLGLVNPLQAFKMAAVHGLGSSMDVLGPAGLYATRRFGEALPALLWGSLVAWIVVPLGAASVLFARRPL